jgi:hypothetical protein
MPEATNDFVIDSDSDANGIGDIVFKTGTTERARIKAADGTGSPGCSSPRAPTTVARSGSERSSSGR